MLALVLKMYALKENGGGGNKHHIQGQRMSSCEYFASKPLSQTMRCSLWAQGRVVSSVSYTWDTGKTQDLTVRSSCLLLASSLLTVSQKLSHFLKDCGEVSRNSTSWALCMQRYVVVLLDERVDVWKETHKKRRWRNVSWPHTLSVYLEDPWSPRSLQQEPPLFPHTRDLGTEEP